ncbi:MAG: DUF981 domain-containing protein [Candidatus Thermoplasmatota archaeon]|nr:DUF981 domain-containing protein [Candidatus Thermoplasmatota archaeon]
MVFIDDLGLEFFTMALAMVLPAYMITAAYFYHRKLPMEKVSEIVRGSGFPLLALGAFMFILGVWSELTWPFPAKPYPSAPSVNFSPYNILFGDPYMILSILIVGVSLSLVMNKKLQFIGVLGFFSGILAIFYGYQAYIDSFTKSPLEAFFLYIAFGVVGILSLPATLIFDSVEENKKTKTTPIETIFLFLFWLGLIAAALASGYMVLNAIPGHLLKTP